MQKNEVRYVVDLPYKLKIVILQMKEGSNQKIVKVKQDLKFDLTIEKC